MDILACNAGSAGLIGVSSIAITRERRTDSCWALKIGLDQRDRGRHHLAAASFARHMWKVAVDTDASRQKAAMVLPLCAWRCKRLRRSRTGDA
jgi:hypothetical protein